MRRKHKKFISILLTMAVAITPVSALNVFAADTDTNDTSNDSDIVIEANDTVLVKDVDYTLEYEDNVKVGTGKVIVHFIGNYSGEKEQTFNIVRKSSGGGGGGSSSSAIKTTPTPTPTATPAETDNSEETANPTDKPTETEAPTENIHSSYLKGYEDNTVHPDAPITRAEAAAILTRTLDIQDNSQTAKTFPDVTAADWFYGDINKMSSAGIITGYEDGTFHPNSPVSREEFVAMLVRNWDVLTFADIPFTDVKPNVWSSDYIYTAFANGYINGYEDNTFKPEASITRAEAVKILNGILGRDDFSGTENPFSDLSENHWAYKQILEAAVDHIPNN